MKTERVVPSGMTTLEMWTPEVQKVKKSIVKLYYYCIVGHMTCVHMCMWGWQCVAMNNMDLCLLKHDQCYGNDQ